MQPSLMKNEQVAPSAADWDNCTVSVVIPTLNEAKNLPHVLPLLPDLVTEVLLIDGGSTDGTTRVAKELRNDIVIIEDLTPGKGAALRRGFQAASGDIIVMIDADGSMDPGEIPAFVGALLGGADYAKGSRFCHGGGTSDMEWYRRLGNSVFVWMVRLGFGGRYSDLCYGYNAFWAGAVDRLDLDASGFEVETMMNIRALTSGMKIVEVPSYEAPRIHGSSNLKTVRDGWRVLRTIFRERSRKPAPVQGAESGSDSAAAQVIDLRSQG